MKPARSSLDVLHSLNELMMNLIMVAGLKLEDLGALLFVNIKLIKEGILKMGNMSM
jgi:hypothetical protein